MKKSSIFSLLSLVAMLFASIAFAQAEAPKCEEKATAECKAPEVAVAKPAADSATAELGVPMRPVIPAPIGKTTPAGWFDDWNRASAEARRTNRPILVLFTGSDWCPHCKILRETILDKPEFKHFADEKLILVYMDEPSDTELPLALQQTRKQLKRLLTPGNGVPTAIVLSPAGERWKAIPGYSDDYVKGLKELLKKHGF